MNQIRIPSFWRALSALFVKEIRQNWKPFCLTLLAILFIILLTYWKLLPTISMHSVNIFPNVEWIVISSVIPFVWVLVGAGQINNEFAQNTHLLLKGLPISGFTIVFAKFVWLWLAAFVLSAVVLGWVLFSGGAESQGHRDIVFYFFKSFHAFSLVGIAISLFSAVVNEVVGGFKWIIFLLIYILVKFVLSEAIEYLTSANWGNLPQAIALSTVVLNSILSALLLALTGWLFSRQR